MKTFTIDMPVRAAHKKMALALAELEAQKNPNSIVDILFDVLRKTDYFGYHVNAKSLAVLARIALKKNLPGYKFSVRSGKFMFVDVTFDKGQGLTTEQVRSALDGLIHRNRDGSYVQKDTVTRSVSFVNLFVQEAF